MNLPNKRKRVKKTRYCKIIYWMRLSVPWRQNQRYAVLLMSARTRVTRIAKIK